VSRVAYRADPTGGRRLAQKAFGGVAWVTGRPAELDATTPSRRARTAPGASLRSMRSAATRESARWWP